MCREKALKQSRPGFLAFLLCTVTQNSVWHRNCRFCCQFCCQGCMLFESVWRFNKSHFRVLATVSKRIVERGAVHLCLRVAISESSCLLVKRNFKPSPPRASTP